MSTLPVPRIRFEPRHLALVALALALAWSSAFPAQAELCGLDRRPGATVPGGYTFYGKFSGAEDNREPLPTVHLLRFVAEPDFGAATDLHF